MRNHKKMLYGILIFIILIVGGYFAACKVASIKAMEIFNREMAKQEELKGKITVEDIDASMFGNITLTNLLWTDDEGNTIVSIPESKIRIKPQDVVLNNINTTTIQGLEINNAEVSVRFDKDMHVDVVKKREHEEEKPKEVEKKPQTPEEREAAYKQREEKLRQRIKNVDFAGKQVDANIKFNNCKLTAYYKNRVFVINDVNSRLNIDTTKEADVRFTTGPFSGTVVGNGIELSGKIDMKTPVPTYKLHMVMNAINPASLGLGVNIDDKVDIVTAINGELPAPVIDGNLHFERLVIPGITFNKVNGKLHYEEGILDFKDVTATAFGGDVTAEGTYNINTRKYEIDAHGVNLNSAAATKDLAFQCSVKLDLKMICDGDPKTVLSYGKISAGKGNYHLVPFKGLHGDFSNQSGVLSFKDVVINTQLGDVKTDAFTIEKGRVKLGPIYLDVLGSNEHIRIR